MKLSLHMSQMIKLKPKNWPPPHIWITLSILEAPIGKALADKGEALLREKLREQIDGNASIDEIKQNIADINKLL